MALMEKRWDVRVVERRAVLMSWRMVASLAKTMECEKGGCFAVWTVALTAELLECARTGWSRRLESWAASRRC